MKIVHAQAGGTKPSSAQTCTIASSQALDVHLDVFPPSVKLARDVRETRVAGKTSFAQNK